MLFGSFNGTTSSSHFNLWSGSKRVLRKCYLIAIKETIRNKTVAHFCSISSKIWCSKNLQFPFVVIVARTRDSLFVNERKYVLTSRIQTHNNTLMFWQLSSCHWFSMFHIATMRRSHAIFKCWISRAASWQLPKYVIFFGNSVEQRSCTRNLYNWKIEKNRNFVVDSVAFPHSPLVFTSSDLIYDIYAEKTIEIFRGLISFMMQH